MSKGEPKKSSRGGAGGEEARALYVYCVGARGELARVFGGELPPAIESSGGLELIAGGELAAVASAVPLSDYGEEALGARLEDASWTAVRALRHEGVVEHFARRAAVAPLRFGTIYLRRESVGRMLEERGGELRRVLARLEGREEWGVNVYAERAKLKAEVARLSPRLREMSERADSSAPGQAYLLRKKVDALRDEETRAETKRAAAEMEAALAAESVGAARLRLLKDEANERGELAAKFAFLVPRDAFDRFRAAAERLAERYAPLGFRIELTGPWPAYNFANDDESFEGVEGEEGRGRKGG
jgi:hypothetical protein